jgi:hypothetical protein
MLVVALEDGQAQAPAPSQKPPAVWAVVERLDIQQVTLVVQILVVAAVVVVLYLQAQPQQVLVVLGLSLLDIHNQQPMLFLTSTPLRFGNAQQVLTQLTTW